MTYNLLNYASLSCTGVIYRVEYNWVLNLSFDCFSLICRGPWTLTKQIVRNEGFRGLFRGLTPTFAREMPGYFFFFGGYEVSRYMFTPQGKTKDDLSKLHEMVICSHLGNSSLHVGMVSDLVICDPVDE